MTSWAAEIQTEPLEPTVIEVVKEVVKEVKVEVIKEVPVEIPMQIVEKTIEIQTEKVVTKTVDNPEDKTKLAEQENEITNLKAQIAGISNELAIQKEKPAPSFINKVEVAIREEQPI